MNRPSPSDSATKYKVGTVKKGNDGNMWTIVKTSTGVHRWQKVDPHEKLKKAKKYVVHDNGGRPFLIFVDKSSVYVYTVNPKSDFDRKLTVADYSKLLFTFKNVKKVYPGKDREYGYTGNTVLLELKDRYVFIGERIYEFKTEDSITKYYSTVGNSDVPYPVAVGTKYAYFMLDNVYVDIGMLPNGPKTDWADAYGDFYSFKNPKKISKKMKGFKLLQKRLY